MNQIPNIEETKDFPELEKQYVAMWDKGEFEWNHHEGDELGKKPISPWRIWTTFIKPTLHHQLQKAPNLEELSKAWHVEGINPEYHRQQKALLAKNWPSLYQAIVKLL